jgi:hypothetical protein
MEFKYAIVDNIDYTLEEQGNQFTALRKIRWGDSDKEYLEMRRWRNTPDGGEQAAKGCTFMTDEGPANLINALIELGYGNTKEVLGKLSDRTDFRKSLNSLLGKDDELYDDNVGTLEDDYYDPKSLIGG